jgi:hypothetical protein
MADHETDDHSLGSAGKATSHGEISNRNDRKVSKISRRINYLKTFLNRLSFWPFVWRIALYSAISFSLVLAAIIGWSSYYVNNDRVERWIKDLVYQETGGKIAISQTEANILNGIALHGIQYFPPDSPVSSGQLGAFSSQNQPAIDIKKVELAYSLLGLLAGQINIRALKITQPIVRFERNGERSNFDGLLLHLETKKREREKINQKGFQDPDKSESLDGGVHLSKISPSMLYMPVKVLARNIGIERLRLEIVEHEGTRSVKKTVLDGPTVDVWTSWHGTRSHFGVSVGSYLDQSIRFSIAKENIDKDSLGEKIIVSSEAKVIGQLVIDDLQRIKINVAIQTDKLSQGSIAGGDITLLADANLDFKFDKMQLDVKRISVEIPNSLKYILEGNLRVLDLAKKTIAIDIVNNASLDISDLMSKMRNLLPSVRGSGSIDIANLRINGVVTSDDFENMFSSEAGSPEISGEIVFDDLSFESKNPEVSVTGMLGSIKFGGAKALTGGGVGIDHVQKMHLEGIKWRGAIKGGETITAEAMGIDIESTARFVWPKVHAQMTRITISAEKLKVSGKKIKGWDAPLYFEISAEGDKEVSRNIASLTFEWKDLVELSAGFDCHLKCRKFGGEIRTKIHTFDGLYAALIGGLDPYLGNSFKPSKIGGSLAIQLDFEGRNPSGLSADIDSFLKDGDIDFKSSMALSRLNLKFPFNSLEVKDLGLRIDVDGDTAEQRITLDSKSREINSRAKFLDKNQIGSDSAITASMANDTESLGVEGLSFSLEVLNKFIDRPNRINFADKMSTEIYAKAGFVNVLKSRVPLKTFSLGRISVELAQEAFREFEVRRLATNLPDLGFGASIKGKTSLDERRMPKDFVIDSNVEVSRTESLNAIPGISSRGAIKSSFKLRSTDMKKVLVSGAFDFERFALIILNKGLASNPKLVMEDVNGQIPVEQSLVIPDRIIAAIKGHSTIGVITNSNDANPIKDSRNPDEKREKGAILSSKLDELELIARRYLQHKSETKQLESSKLVDAEYSSIRDFFPNRKAVSIKRLVVANIEMSDITLDTEWREGIVGLNEFMIGLLGGQMQGNIQVHIAPDIDKFEKNPKKIDRFFRKVVTNIQITRVDTRKILDRIPGYQEASSRSTSFFADPYIDATIHLFWNIESRDLEGGIDITTIGKEQVRMLLSYIDPSESDPTINDIRKGLILGDVRQVSIPIKNGEIGLDVEIKALSVPIPTPKLSRFPISQLIDNAIRSQSS